MNATEQAIVMENAFLKVDVQPDTGNVTITHKGPGVTWRMDPTQGDSGRIEVCDKQSLEWITAPAQRWTSRKTLKFGVPGRAGIIFGQPERENENGADCLRVKAEAPDLPGTFVTLEYRLAAETPDIEFRVRVFGPQAGLVTSAAFPTGLSVEPGEEGYLILPCGTGLIVPNGKYTFTENRRLYAGGGKQGYTMRFFGASKSGQSKRRSTYTGLLDCSLQMLVEARSADGRVSVGPKIYGADIALDGWRRDYSAKYHFLSGTGYVGAAKWYREWAQAQGMIKTFVEKLKEHPDLARLPGAFYVSGLMFYYNWEPYVAVMGEEQARKQFLVKAPFKKVYRKFADVLPYIGMLKSAGVRRAVFHLAGWNHYGYDGKYPDIMPANDESGGPEAFRRLCKAIRDAGYVAVPHDDVMITFEDAPSYAEETLARQMDGSPYYLGTWPGGNSFIVNAQHQLEFVRRNLPLVAGEYRPNGYYLDCETNVPPVHDFSPEHPLSMTEDLQLRGALFEEVHRYVDVVGSETIADWAAPYLDYAGHAFDGYEFVSAEAPGKEIEGVVVPLWDLVYHDVMYGQRTFDGGPASEPRNAFVDYMRTFLRTLRAGTLPPSIQFDMQLRSFDRLRRQAESGGFQGWSSLTKEQIIRTLSELSALVGDLTMTLPMTDHRFVTEDHRVETTVFGDNVNISVNGKTEPFELSPDITLAPLGFIAEAPRFVAMYVTRYGQWLPAHPTLFWAESADGLPLADSKQVRVYRAFGDDVIPFQSSCASGRSDNGKGLSRDSAGRFLLEVVPKASYLSFGFGAP